MNGQGMDHWNQCESVVGDMKDQTVGLGKGHHQEKHASNEFGQVNGRFDSGICDSFRSDSFRSNSFQSDSLGSTGAKSVSLMSERSSLNSVPMDETKERISSLDSGLGSLGSLDCSRTKSISQKFNELKIEETVAEEDAPSLSLRKEFITLAQLKARTKEQKLRDLEQYDFNTSEEIKSEERCDSGLCESSRCSSLIEEDERPAHFQQDSDGDTFCHLAIVHGQTLHAKQVIDACPSWHLLNIQNDLGQTPLHLATLTNQSDIVRQLVCRGATVEMRDRHGNTPLHLASKEGFLDCAVSLTRRVRLEKSSNVHVPFQMIPQAANLQNYEGETCLQLAAAGSHFDVMKHLVIECRADINQADWKSGRTLLHSAVEANNLPLVEFLLSHPKIDVDKKTYEGHTPLQLAIGRRLIEVNQLLVLAGALDCSGPPSASSSASEDEEDTEEDMKVNEYDSDIDDGFDDMEYNGQAVCFR